MCLTISRPTLIRLTRSKAWLCRFTSPNPLICCKHWRVRLMMPRRRLSSVKDLSISLRTRSLSGTRRRNSAEEMKSLRKLIIFFETSRMIWLQKLIKCIQSLIRIQRNLKRQLQHRMLRTSRSLWKALKSTFQMLRNWVSKLISFLRKRMNALRNLTTKFQQTSKMREKLEESPRIWC